LTVQSSDLSRSLHIKSGSVSKPLIGGTTFHFVFLAAVVWFVVGDYLDSWAHNNIAQLETFFTPWHGVLYSGLFAIAVLLSATIWINHRRGADWIEAIPKGYELSTIFVYAMFFVGVGDATWHTLFGIEKNVDGLLSPTHISGMLFSGLVILGPYRALSSRKGALSRAEQMILTITITLFLAYLAVLTQETTTYTRLWPLTVSASNNDGQLLAVLSFIFQGLILGGLSLIVMRRWKLPFGLYTCALLVVGAGMSFMRGQYVVDILVGLIAGLLLDVSYHFLHPDMQHTDRMRLFTVIAASAIPFVYLPVVWLTQGALIWSIHLIIGSVGVCAIFGWMLTYVAIPPTQYEEA